MDPYRDDVSPEELADQLERIARDVAAMLTPQELAIRREHVKMMVEVERILEQAAGGDSPAG